MSIQTSLREFQHLTAQQWLDRASRTLPQTLSVILVVAIAWQLVQLTWLLLDRSAELVPAPIPPAPPTANSPRESLDIQSIVSAHLFGVPQAEPSQDAANAPQTQMSLVLSAVFASSDPSKGLAVIGDSAQASKVYTVGTSVRPGTRLHAVYFDRVILDRGGQLETLALPKQNTIAMNRPPVPAPGQNQFVENVRRIAESNPSAFAEIVRPQPVFANGEQRGYRVYPGRNRQLFSKLGLQPGDLVLSINGTPLDDPQRGMEIFNTMSSSDRVQVTVERNGQAQELLLNTAQITLPDAEAGATPSRALQPKAQTGFTQMPEAE